MSDLIIFRDKLAIEWVTLEYQNNEIETLGLDRDTKDVYVSPVYFPGGWEGFCRAGALAGEPAFEHEGHYYIRATFVMKHTKSPVILRGVNRRIEIAQRAWEDNKVEDPLTDAYQEKAKAEGMPHV